MNQWPNIKDLPYILFFILPFLIHLLSKFISLNLFRFIWAKSTALGPSIQCDLLVLLKNQISSFASKQNSYSKYYTAALCSEKRLTAGLPSQYNAIFNAEKTEKELEEKSKNETSWDFLWFILSCISPPSKCIYYWSFITGL